MTALTRRDALVAVAAAPLAALYASAPAAAAGRAPTLEGDAAVITELLSREHLGAAAYAHAGRRGGSRVRALARRFGSHEAEHEQALATAREALGVPPLETPSRAQALDALAAALGRRPFPRSAGDAVLLRGLLAVEEWLLGGWVDAAGRLRDPNLLRTAAQVLASHAQHVAVLRTAVGHDPLPRALDSGSGG